MQDSQFLQNQDRFLAVHIYPSVKFRSRSSESNQGSTSAGGAKRKRSEIRHRIQLPVVPRRIADGQIDTNVLVSSEILRVYPFTGAGIQHASTGNQTRSKTFE